jgi:putative glutamine amidotransferase
LDGFLIPGGQSDVDPALYAQENQWSTNINTENDRILIDVIVKIVQSWKPMLWICKGMQLINVALWGLLIQDVPNTEYSFDCIHNVNITHDSKLFQIYKQQILSVNSLHHQAVKQVGKWLCVVAHNEEWIIEAIESEDWKIIWVQWHPEYIKEQNCLFKDFFGI